LCPVWAIPAQERFQRRPANIVRGLDHRTCERRLGELVCLTKGYKEDEARL